MDTNELIQKSKGIGADSPPVGGASNSEAATALVAILGAPENKGKFFRSQSLAKLLTDNGIEVSKIGNILFALKNQKKCSSVSVGVYTSYDAKYDKRPSPKED